MRRRDGPSFRGAGQVLEGVARCRVLVHRMVPALYAMWGEPKAEYFLRVFPKGISLGYFLRMRGNGGRHH
eukprot:2131899-Prymnesium_polylepis.3